MPNSYCWGSTYNPVPILDESNDFVIVGLNGRKTIPVSKILGRVSNGDRIQVLVSGGNWLWATAEASENKLWVVLDNGRRWILNNGKFLKNV